MAETFIPTLDFYHYSKVVLQSLLSLGLASIADGNKVSP